MNSIILELKAKRIENNISIEKIASDLCIRKQYLIAIEENNQALMPAQVYVEGYIKLYAQYLKIDISKISEVEKESPNNFKPQSLSKPYIESSIPSLAYLLISLFMLIILPYIWFSFTKITPKEINTTKSLININNLLNGQFKKTRYYDIVKSLGVKNERNSLDYFLNNYSFPNELEFVNEEFNATPIDNINQLSTQESLNSQEIDSKNYPEN